MYVSVCHLSSPFAHWYAPADLPKILLSIPSVLTEILSHALPYVVDVLLFLAFVYWNGGIVLGESINADGSLITSLNEFAR